MINIQTLGEEYTVTDARGELVNKIQIIPYDELLEAMNGPYSGSFEEYPAYVTGCINSFAGLEGISPHEVLWHVAYKPEIELTKVILYAVTNDYTRIIVEYVDDFENAS